MPDCVSEGDSPDPPPINSANPIFSTHDGMNREIARLHALGRSGALDAEPHLNAFLAAARAGDPRYRMPLADAPQFGNLPDLWRFVHSAIVGSSVNGLELLIRQALPCFKRPEAQLPPLESAGPVAISLILGLLAPVRRENQHFRAGARGARGARRRRGVRGGPPGAGDAGDG